MKKLMKWQQTIIDEVELMPNAVLLKEAFNYAEGQEYLDNRDMWKYLYIDEELTKRLGDWLKK